MSFTNAEYCELLGEIVKSNPNTLLSLLRIVKLYSIEPDFTTLKFPLGRNSRDCITAYNYLLARNPGRYDTLDERNGLSVYDVEMEKELDKVREELTAYKRDAFSVYDIGAETALEETREELEAYKLAAEREKEEKRLRAEEEPKRLKEERQKVEKATRARSEAAEVIVKWKQELDEEKEEHQFTINKFDLLSAKYEESLRTLAELQDAVDEARHPPNGQSEPEEEESEKVRALRIEVLKHRETALAFESTLKEIGQTIQFVAAGDLSKKITVRSVEMHPEIRIFKRSMNVLYEQMLRNRDIGENEVQSQRQIAELLEATLHETANILDSVARGDLSKRITLTNLENHPGIVNFKRIVNNLVDRLQNLSSEVIYLATEVGQEGVLGVQADVSNFRGVWEKLVNEVNGMASQLTYQTRGISTLATSIAYGDLGYKLDRPAKGEIFAMQGTVNDMIDQLRSFVTKITQLARDLSSGILGGQAYLEATDGMWKTCTIHVNKMANLFTTQTRSITSVATAVRIGNYQGLSFYTEPANETLDMKEAVNAMLGYLKVYPPGKASLEPMSEKDQPSTDNQTKDHTLILSAVQEALDTANEKIRHLEEAIQNFNVQVSDNKEEIRSLKLEESEMLEHIANLQHDEIAFRKRLGRETTSRTIAAQPAQPASKKLTEATADAATAAVSGLMEHLAEVGKRGQSAKDILTTKINEIRNDDDLPKSSSQTSTYHQTEDQNPLPIASQEILDIMNESDAFERAKPLQQTTLINKLDSFFGDTEQEKLHKKQLHMKQLEKLERIWATLHTNL